MRYRGLIAAYVAFAAPTVAAQGLPRWVATRDLLIDGEEHVLVPVGFVRADSSGRIYFTQAKDFAIRVFGPDGKGIRTVGRQGNGPGEFAQLGRIGLIGDTLWAIDASGERVVRFLPNGRHLRTTAYERVGGTKAALSSLLPRAVLSDGSLIGEGYFHPRGTPPALKGDTTLVMRMTSKGVITRTFGVRLTEQQETAFSAYDADGRWRPSFNENPPAVETSVEGAFVAIARAAISGPEIGTASVTLMRASGDTVYSRRVPATMIPIPARVVDSAFDALSRHPFYGSRMHLYPKPEIYPPVEYVRIARDGAVILAFHTDTATRDFLLLEPDGRLRASLRLPRAVRVHQIEGLTLWGTERNADGVDSVVRYRITGPAA